MSEGNKKQELDLKETDELLDFAEGVMSDLVKHKSDDGKIDMGEWAQTGIANAPAGVKAVMGGDKIIPELKDVDAKEAQHLAGRGVKLAQLVLALFAAKKESK